MIPFTLLPWCIIRNSFKVAKQLRDHNNKGASDAEIVADERLAKKVQNRAILIIVAWITSVGSYVAIFRSIISAGFIWRVQDYESIQENPLAFTVDAVKSQAIYVCKSTLTIFFVVPVSVW